jgi:hypothetical protein
MDLYAKSEHIYIFFSQFTLPQDEHEERNWQGDKEKEWRRKIARTHCQGKDEASYCSIAEDSTR